jgi:hypothetical protein
MIRLVLPSMLALALLSCCAQADELGRLFFSPQQRAQLDYQHAQNAASDGNGNDASGLTVNGIVQKNGGARTVWINGVPQDAGHSDERNPASVPVSVPGRSKPVKIKVGQKLLPEAPAESSVTGQ